VIIPAHGSPTDLARVLGLVAEQDWPRGRLQVVVGIDGVDAELEAVASDLADDVVVLPVNNGSYAARNAALKLLADDVDVVCFTDSDCLPDPGWVSAHVVALAHTDMSGGAIDVTLREKPSAAEYVDKLRHLKQHYYVTVDRYAATANLAVRRAVVDAQEFDASLRSGGDADFCRTALLRGFTLEYTEDAVVRHPARTSTREVRIKVRRICSGIRATPDRWRDRVVPDWPRGFNVPRHAWATRLSRNPVWLLHAFALERWASLAIRRAVIDVKRGQGQPA
jgi:glycosyltransferase involved in cell wall biosynthesis